MMAEDPRWRRTVFSGLTRREQRVLVVLIVVVGAGVAYQQWKGGWRREGLVLHRADSRPDRSSSPGLSARRGEPGGGLAGKTEDILLDLNTASAAELEQLPNIGPVRANAIVQFRERYGPFARIEDLVKVSGIGEKTLEAVRPHLKPIDQKTTGPAGVEPKRETPLPKRTVPTPVPEEEPPPVNINTADAEELATLKGIGSVLAARIIEYRQKHGPFRSVGELKKVSGIGPAVLRNNPGRIVVGPPR